MLLVGMTPPRFWVISAFLLFSKTGQKMKGKVQLLWGILPVSFALILAMSLQHVKGEEHRWCSSLLHHSSPEVMSVQSGEEGRLMELYLEVQMSLQQKRTQKLVLPQLQLNLSLLQGLQFPYRYCCQFSRQQRASEGERWCASFSASSDGGFGWTSGRQLNNWVVNINADYWNLNCRVSSLSRTLINAKALLPRRAEQTRTENWV